MKKEKAKQMAQDILENVGGPTNISKVLHCATRLRFNLKDESIANKETIEKIKGVLGTMVEGGQFQIIVGPEVDEVYNELLSLAHLDNQDKNELTQEKKKFSLKALGNGILDAISGSMGPAIPVIVASAFFKMLVAVLGPNMANLISAKSDLYILFTFVGDTSFYFFPVIVGYTSAKKFGTSPVLGILLEAVMIHPTFVALAAKGASFSVLGIPCHVQNYSSTILPIIMSTWVMSHVSKFFDKIIPGIIRSVFSPAFTLFVMLPITLCFLGPLGSFLGTYIVAGLFGLKNIIGFVGVGLVAALFPILVITGMHMLLITSCFQVFASVGYDNFAGVAMAVSSFAIMGVGIGAALRLKNKEQKALSISYAVTAMIAGTSEPTSMVFVQNTRNVLSVY